MFKLLGSREILSFSLDQEKPVRSLDAVPPTLSNSTPVGFFLGLPLYLLPVIATVLVAVVGAYVALVIHHQKLRQERCLEVYVEFAQALVEAYGALAALGHEQVDIPNQLNLVTRLAVCRFKLIIVGNSETVVSALNLTDVFFEKWMEFTSQRNRAGSAEFRDEIIDAVNDFQAAQEVFIVGVRRSLSEKSSLEFVRRLRESTTRAKNAYDSFLRRTGQSKR